MSFDVFWWGRTPHLQSAPEPPPATTRYHTHRVGGFKLVLGKKEMTLPPGSELSIPYEVTGQDTIPDWSKV
jgi:hypothetical protein